MKTNYNSKTTLFEAISITIDGQEYALEKVTPPIILEALKYQQAAEDGDIAASIQQLSILTGAPIEAINTLDIREVKEALVLVSGQITKAKRKSTAAVPATDKPDENEGEEKN